MYFTPVDSNGPTKYVPRSVQVDLEAGVCNHVSFIILLRCNAVEGPAAEIGAAWKPLPTRHVLHWSVGSWQ